MVARMWLRQHGCQREGFWEVIRHMVSPFDLPQTLPIGGRLLVSCSLPGHCHKITHTMVGVVPGDGGWFQAGWFP